MSAKQPSSDWPSSFVMAIALGGCAFGLFDAVADLAAHKEVTGVVIAEGSSKVDIEYFDETGRRVITVSRGVKQRPRRLHSEHALLIPPPVDSSGPGRAVLKSSKTDVVGFWLILSASLGLSALGGGNQRPAKDNPRASERILRELHDRARDPAWNAAIDREIAERLGTAPKRKQRQRRRTTGLETQSGQPPQSTE